MRQHFDIIGIDSHSLIGIIGLHVLVYALIRQHYPTLQTKEHRVSLILRAIMMACSSYKIVMFVSMNVVMVPLSFEWLLYVEMAVYLALVYALDVFDLCQVHQLSARTFTVKFIDSVPDVEIGGDEQHAHAE
jgi:hypothetical protein